MTTDIAALIAEARQAAQWAATTPGFPQACAEALDEALDALESLTAPATTDEREEIARIIRDADDKAYAESGWFAALPTGLADAILAAGFRRSARVPVSRDELADVIQATLDDLHGIPQVRPASSRVRALAKALDDEYDIFPKADSKPADSGTGGDS